MGRKKKEGYLELLTQDENTVAYWARFWCYVQGGYLWIFDDMVSPVSLTGDLITPKACSRQ